MSFDEQPDGDIHADNPAIYSAEGVQCYLFALLDEANRRGGMFPQTGDEQRSDSKAVHRVCEMVDWYARSGEPKPKQIDRLLKLRARNKMTNRETDGDIHGERAAESEPSELSAFEKWWAMLSKVPYMSKKEIAERAFYAGETASHELRFDACRPYLKDGETPAECLARNRADIVRLMGKWGAEKMRSAKLRDDLDKIAQTTGSDDPCRPHLKEGETVADALIRMQKEITTLRNAAMQLWAGRSTFDKGNDMSKAESTTTVQWFKNGDHPLDYAEDREGFENGELVTFSAALCKAKEWEGAIVRYFRHPNIDELADCPLCGATMHEHGWLDDGGNGQAVCPGDFIVTTDGRHAVVQQPARAESTSRRQQAQDMKDAARYRWLLEHPTFAVHCFIYLPGHVSAEIDKERAAQEVAG